MKKQDTLRAWGRILQGYYPMLSIEITRECPLRCPGCYAYQPQHLHQLGPLAKLSDFKGDQLVANILSLLDLHRPIHLSIVGGEPLVRFRELDILLPQISHMGIEVQLVTSAVRPIPQSWSKIRELHLVVSIDGLQPEHDLRRAPATYDRILKNISGHQITVHCTVTRQMLARSGYFDEFLRFWSERQEVRKIWFSLFTPQVDGEDEEILSWQQRKELMKELAELRSRYEKLEMPDSVIRGYLNPPERPEECIFARTTLNVTADLESRIEPCQFGGEPDCRQCGCVASAGLKAVGDYRLLGIVPLRSIFKMSEQIGKRVSRVRSRLPG